MERRADLVGTQRGSPTNTTDGPLPIQGFGALTNHTRSWLKRPGSHRIRSTYVNDAASDLAQALSFLGTVCRMDRIELEPLGRGWAVHVNGVANPMVFGDARCAAATARLLADRLQAAGAPTLVLIGGTVRSRHHDPRWRPRS